MPWATNFDTEQALDVAMHLFWSRGFEATSTEMLVREMGINKGSLYNTYGGKRDLFIAALARYDETYRCELLAQCRATGSGITAIREIFNHWIRLATKHRHRAGCLITNTAVELAEHDKEIQSIVARSQRDVEKFFRESISQAQADGEIDSTVDGRAAARALLGSFIGLLVLSRSRPEPALLKAIVDSALDVIERKTL